MNKEWISIEDELPRPCDVVIFCTQEATLVGWLETYDEAEDLSWVACDTNEWIEEVTHWMPLPEPYYED